MTISTDQQGQAGPLTCEAVLARIDAMMEELQSLRRVVVAMQVATPDQTAVEEEPIGDSIVDRLWGALGQGTKEELVAYQKDMYMEVLGL